MPTQCTTTTSPSLSNVVAHHFTRRKLLFSQNEKFDALVEILRRNKCAAKNLGTTMYHTIVTALVAKLSIFLLLKCDSQKIKLSKREGSILQFVCPKLESCTKLQYLVIIGY
jgi:hypothetical protein